MAINLAGQAIQDVRVAGVQAQRVMLGTGSTAVEVWSASPYPLTGTWGPTNISTAATFDSHTIEEAGEYTITHTATSSGSPYVFASSIRTPNGLVGGSAGSPSTATLTEQLQPGDLIEFVAASIGASIGTGSWSIVKN